MKKILLPLLISNLFANNITIYSDKAMIDHDFQVPVKNKEILIKNLSQKIIKDSIYATIDNSSILSLSYNNKETNLNSLIQKNIGKKVKYFDGEGILLTENLLKTNEGIQYVDIKDLVFENNETQSSLKLNIDKDLKNTKLNLKYLISDISWKASYTLNDNHIQGWLSISNDTGENISDMNLTCISGETKKFETRVMLMAADSMSKVSQEEDSSGRYLFKYNKTFNIENNEVKKLLFIDEDINVKRFSKIESNFDSYNYMNRKLEAYRYISFTSKNALASGEINSYSKDDVLRYDGISNIKTTPKNTEVNVKLSEDADLDVNDYITKFEEKEKHFYVENSVNIKNNSERNIELKFIKNNMPNKESDTCNGICTKTKKDNKTIYTINLKALESYSINFKYE